ncbi:MAG: hypothetical protein C0177_04585 [Fervidicoccus fontis]|nr:MAG: hypothetical protein C0177_04585 [Fervidicoccus fontis]
MSSNENDIRDLIDRLLTEIASKSSINRKKFPVGPFSPNGIYYFDNGEWKLLRRDGLPFQPGENGDGIYVVYFDNTQCSACRRFDPEWYSFVEEYKDRGKFYIILCDWFARECDSKAASRTFFINEVRASPTTMIFLVKEGAIVKNERIEGSVKKEELASKFKSFISS